VLVVFVSGAVGILAGALACLTSLTLDKYPLRGVPGLTLLSLPTITLEPETP
jgi:hypothetical protein